MVQSPWYCVSTAVWESRPVDLGDPVERQAGPLGHLAHRRPRVRLEQRQYDLVVACDERVDEPDETALSGQDDGCAPCGLRGLGQALLGGIGPVPLHDERDGTAGLGPGTRGHGIAG